MLGVGSAGVNNGGVENTNTGTMAATLTSRGDESLRSPQKHADKQKPTLLIRIAPIICIRLNSSML